MLGWVKNIETATLENKNFRTVLFTGEHSQLTVMSLQPGEDIGNEVHVGHDQFLRIEAGSGKARLGRNQDQIEEEYEVGPEWAIIIPAGVWHNVVNTSDGEMKLYSIYSPAEHPAGTVHVTKAEAEAAETVE